MVVIQEYKAKYFFVEEYAKTKSILIHVYTIYGADKSSELLPRLRFENLAFLLKFLGICQKLWMFSKSVSIAYEQPSLQITQENHSSSRSLQALLPYLVLEQLLHFIKNRCVQAKLDQEVGNVPQHSLPPCSMTNLERIRRE